MAILEIKKITKLLVFSLGITLLITALAWVSFVSPKNSLENYYSQNTPAYNFYAKYNFDNKFQSKNFIKQVGKENGMTKIKIQELPLHSKFILDGKPISIGQEIPTEDINNIIFNPYVDELDSIVWSAFDGTKYLATLVTKIGVGSGGGGGGAPSSFVTIAVEKLTTNHLPNITGTCSVGDDMTFTIKKGSSYSTVSETISKLCDASPYALTPTISLPDGKYRVDVDITAGGGAN